MAGFRADFAKMGLADSSDSDEGEDVKKRAAKLLSKEAPAGPSLKIRDQRGVQTWQTATVKSEQPRTEQHGFRAGTTVSTVSSGGVAQRVDTSARTAYGARMEREARPYQGPEVPRPREEKKQAVYVKPAPHVGPPLSHIIDELNSMRADPESYSRKLQALREYYNPADRTFDGRVTVEGVEAHDELIGFLSKQTPVSEPPLKTIDCLQGGQVEGLVCDFKTEARFADVALYKILVCDGDKMRRGRRILDKKLTRAHASFGVVDRGGVKEEEVTLKLCQTFRPLAKKITLSYQGYPIKDNDDFVELLLGLPDPLPNQFTQKLKAKHLIEIDATRSPEEVVVTDHTDGTSVTVTPS